MIESIFSLYLDVNPADGSIIPVNVDSSIEFRTYVIIFITIYLLNANILFNSTCFVATLV